MSINLLLVEWPRNRQYLAELHRIATRVSELDRTIRARLVRHRAGIHWNLLPFYFQPTLSLSIRQPAIQLSLPGRTITGVYTDKQHQSMRMGTAGIPVPKWTVVTPETRLDPETWGPYVVHKPSAGKKGAFVRIRRTERVQYAPPDSFPADHYGRLGPMIAQRFIYTGERPTSFRVVTFFGETLLCYRQWSTRGSPLKSRWAFTGGGIPIVSNVNDMRVELVNDQAVIALAERTHREAFPEFPLLSIDILRDADTGELFVLEAHTRGAGWMFSRKDGLGIQAFNNVDFESQFDAMNKAAQILVREAPRLAATSWPLRRSLTSSLTMSPGEHQSLRAVDRKQALRGSGDDDRRTVGAARVENPTEPRL